MSEKQTVVGRCVEISERSGWTTFHIDIGKQYPVKLATKKEEIVAAGRSYGGGEAAWTYIEKEADAINEHTGKPFINRYLEEVRDPWNEGGAASAETPTEAAPKQHTTPLQGGEKDRAITRMACLRSAAQTLQGTHGDREDLAIGVRVLELAERYERWVMRDIEDIPF